MADHPEPAAVDFKLRKPQAGEERLLGDLVALDCGPSGVRFHVRVMEREPSGERGRVVIAMAAKMDEVEMTSFVDDRDFSIGCGTHASPERVYLTWHPGAADRGVAVAVEFLPKNYVP